MLYCRLSWLNQPEDQNPKRTQNGMMMIELITLQYRYETACLLLPNQFRNFFKSNSITIFLFCSTARDNSLGNLKMNINLIANTVLKVLIYQYCYFCQSGIRFSKKFQIESSLNYSWRILMQGSEYPFHLIYLPQSYLIDSYGHSHLNCW